MHFFGRFLLLLVSVSAAIEQQAAFIQTGDELHYFADTANLQDAAANLVFQQTLQKSANVVVAPGGEASLNQLSFEPTLLQFGKSAVGVPSLRTVSVLNPTASEVRFDAISGTTVHFHCSFFEQKTVPPGGKTSFDVVFLPRIEGKIDNVLLVLSSAGSFAFGVSGTGAPNPYRLRPIVGARVPLNGSFVSPLDVYNPFSSPIRIDNIYTSGGSLHLEYPTGSFGAATGFSSVWEIPPFETRTVMRARFTAVSDRNTTAFIRLKTSIHPQLPLSSLFEPRPPPLPAVDVILPVEVEVSRVDGVFATVDLLHFGFVRNDEPSRPLSLHLYSTIEGLVEIDSFVTEPENAAISIEFEPAPLSLKRRMGSRKVATLTYWRQRVIDADEKWRGAGGKAEEGVTHDSGKIVVRGKGGKFKLAIAFSATIFHGQLLHDTQQTAFYAGHTPPLKKEVSIRNTFSFPVYIHNISLPKPTREAFNILNFEKALILQANEILPVFSVRYAKTVPSPFISFCRIYTNISKFDLPIVVFDGRLRVTVFSVQPDRFDFGLMSVGDKRTIQLAVSNENPAPIALRQFRRRAQPFASIRLLDVRPGNATSSASASTASSAGRRTSASAVAASLQLQAHLVAPGATEWLPGEDFSVPAHSYAIFEYSIVAPSEMSTYNGSVIFETPYETMSYPLSFHVLSGAIVSIPEKIVFEEAFPGKISSQQLQVYSTFAVDMPLVRLSTLAEDTRITFESFEPQFPKPVIKQGEASYLGRVSFNASAGCEPNTCYVGFPLNSTNDEYFKDGMALPSNVADIDHYLFSYLHARWRRMQRIGETTVNATVVVDSEVVRHFRIPMEARLTWPRLLTQSAVHFPLTAVGNFTILNLTLANPTLSPIMVQLIPLTIYPDPEGILELFGDELTRLLGGVQVEYTEKLMFTLRDTELFNLRADSPVPKFRDAVQEFLGFKVPRFALSMILQPGVRVRIRLGFLPTHYEPRSSLLLIRNNLTGLEAVPLFGRGATVELKVGNRNAGGKQPLLFELQERHLADCQNPKRLTHKLNTTLTVFRSFLTHNTGEVPLFITNLSIGGVPCENHGFRVLNCKPFRLNPNRTHLLEIAYTPDFVMSWHEATLQLLIHGNGSLWTYRLASSVPLEWLPRCQAALPRPHWEPLMYYSCVPALVFLLVAVVSLAYLEGDSTVTMALRHRFLQSRRVFDLNAAANAQPISVVRRPPPLVDGDLAATARRSPRHAFAAGFKWLAGWFQRDPVSSQRAAPAAAATAVKPSAAVLPSTRVQPAASNKDETAAPQPQLSKRSRKQQQREQRELQRQKLRQLAKAREPSPRPPSPSAVAAAEADAQTPTVEAPSVWERVGSHHRQKQQQQQQRAAAGSDRDTPAKSRANSDSLRSAAGSRSDVETSRPRRAPLAAAAATASTALAGRNIKAESLPSRSLLAPKLHLNISRPSPSTTPQSDADFPAKATRSTDSEASTPPEWDSGPATNAADFDADYDEEFGLLSSETEKFAAKLEAKVSAADKAAERTLGGSTRPAKPTPLRLGKTAETTSSSRSNSTSSSADALSRSSSPPSPVGGPPPLHAGQPAPVAPVANLNLQRGLSAAVAAVVKNRTAKSAKVSSDSLNLAPGSRPYELDVAPPVDAEKLTFMQELQHKRKQRLLEYKQKQHLLQQNETWPGFDLPPLPESLWDEGADAVAQENSTTVWGTPPQGRMHYAKEEVEESSTVARGARVRPSKLNPSAAPFVSRRSPDLDFELHSANNQTDRMRPLVAKRTLKTRPEPLQDASIVALGPTTAASLSPPKHRPPPQTVAAAVAAADELPSPIASSLGLSGSLFSAGACTIWDPEKPVNPEASWPDDLAGESNKRRII